MTTATEHHDAQLAAIKARHAALAQKFTDPAVTEVAIDADAPLLYQLGLEAVFVDPIGRFWKMSGHSAVMLFDPHGPCRGREDFDIQDHMGLKSPHAQDAA